ncbi:hypothetical protein Fot_29464 [Forsythia ovata]|uniref:Uncharacterized protein n=1 Tax=Forsythia ovata TaxID=205694 RepID=A0ABD1TSH4_9LAMI
MAVNLKLKCKEFFSMGIVIVLMDFLLRKLESQPIIIVDKGKNISESDGCASVRLCVRNTTIEVVILGRNLIGATTMVVLWRHNHVVKMTIDVFSIVSGEWAVATERREMRWVTTTDFWSYLTHAPWILHMGIHSYLH